MNAADCRERAEAWRRDAKRATGERDRAEWLRLADEWLKMAEQIGSKGR
jgi:hypothetical protein